MALVKIVSPSVSKIPEVAPSEADLQLRNILLGAFLDLLPSAPAA